MPNFKDFPQGIELMYERKNLSNSMKSGYVENQHTVHKNRFNVANPIVGRHVYDMKNIRVMPKTIVHKNTDGKLFV